MFRVLVVHLTPVGVDAHPDEIFECISEFTFLEHLYTFDMQFEFAWVKDQPHHAEMLVY